MPPNLFFTVSIAGVNGVLVESTRPTELTNAADQDTFVQQLDNDVLFIGQLPRGPRTLALITPVRDLQRRAHADLSPVTPLTPVTPSF